MRKLIFLLLYSSLISNLYGQDTLNNERPSQIYTISLLEYLPFCVQNSANFNLGKEFYIKKDHSIYSNLGYLHSYGLTFMERSFGKWFKHEATDSRGMKIQIDKRKYINKYQKEKVLYILFWPHAIQPETYDSYGGYYFSYGLSGNFIITNKIQEIPQFYNGNYIGNIQELYKSIRNEYVANVQYGYNSITRSGLVSDFSLGIGMAYIRNFTKNKNYSNILPIEYFNENNRNFYPFWFIAKLRIGFKFNNVKII